jgi:hypothetical protein
VDFYVIILYSDFVCGFKYFEYYRRKTMKTKSGFGILLLVLVILSLSIWTESLVAGERVRNLIPEEAGKTPSYWCTWGAQNYASDDAAFKACVDLEGHFEIADTLTEKSVFEEPGWA